MQLYTGTYQRFTADLGVPIRTTVGAPRFALKYDLSPTPWRSIMPDRAMLNLSKMDFEPMYRAKLDRLGLDRVMAEAEAYERQHGDGRLVALCFDDLRKPDMWCHRQFFGQWLTDQGVPVIELFPEDGSANGVPAPPKAPRARAARRGADVTAQVGGSLAEQYPAPTEPRLF